MDLKELRDKRGKLIADARALLDLAEKEKRDLTDEEDQRYKKLFDDQAKVQDQIDREVKLREAERQAAETALEREKKKAPEKATRGDNTMVAYRSWLKSGKLPEETPDEFRALQADVDVSGGYLVPPEQFVQDLLKAVDDLVFIRQLATVYPLKVAASLGVPSLDTDPADFDWTSEIGTVSEDTSMAFGKRSLEPQPLSKLIKVSRKFLRIGALNPENIVKQRLAYKFGITQEKAFLTGSGANQPLGLFTASSDGISTGRDSSSGSSTSITADSLRAAKYGLKAQYRAKSKWLFHRDGVEIISKLKDGNNQYLWRPGLVEADPDRLLGLPILESEYVPNTFTTGLYVGMLGDYSFYWIAESLAMELQRLGELYAEKNQVGFIGRGEIDGMPAMEEAFIRLKTD